MMAKQSKTTTRRRRRPKKDNEEKIPKALDAVVRSEPTTRICIKNVPYSVTEIEQVKRFLFQSQESYFSTTPLTITDCRILTKRHMAFVGFQNQQCAMACVKYLHSTYWKTSKIVVEYAFPPKETKKKAEQRDPVTENERKTESSMKQNSSSVPLEKKKKDLLDYIGGTAAKPTFWSNDDILPPVTDGHVQKPGDEAENTDTSGSSSSDSDGDESDSDNSSAEDDAEPLFESNKGMSDMDFLRAKTVRVEELSEEIGDTDNADTWNLTIEEAKDEIMEMKTGFPTDAMEVHEEPEISSRRLFVRNLPFSVAEADLSDYFSQFGTLDECHVPVDDQHRSKGFAFVSFQDPDRSQYAREESDGKDFQGRIIQVLPARAAKSSQQNPASSPSTYKGKQEMERQHRADQDQKGWSASFVRGDAVVDNLAFRLGLKKGDVLGVKDGLSAGDAAVRLALGETAIIEENRKYFVEHGIDMEALVSLRKDQIESEKIERSKVSFLVKNLPGDTTKDDLLKCFGTSGVNPTRILLPPSRTIAVVEYAHANEAKSAFRKLAYRRFKDVPLYLEWAPLAASTGDDMTPENETEINEADAVGDTTERDDESGKVALPTLYVKNLNFTTTEEELHTFFSSISGDIRSVRIPTKVTPAKRVAGKVLREEKSVSMGFGFVEFSSSDAAVKAMERAQGKMLSGHKLELQPTKLHGHESASVTNSKKKSSKLMVRNVPFQANRKELLTLFGSFGQLKRLRLPKKFDGNHRGFAFVDYVSSKEATEAMKTLSKTHLYGRHLVIEWAEDEEETKISRPIEGTPQPQNKKIRFS